MSQAVADRGAQAWSHWSGNDGIVGVGWVGYASGPYLGRFTCGGKDRPGGGARETCFHVADSNAGDITVKFAIYPAPSN